MWGGGQVSLTQPQGLKMQKAWFPNPKIARCYQKMENGCLAGKNESCLLYKVKRR